MRWGVSFWGRTVLLLFEGSPENFDGTRPKHPAQHERADFFMPQSPAVEQMVVSLLAKE